MNKYMEEQFTDDFKKTICGLTENKVYSSLIFLCIRN